MAALTDDERIAYAKSMLVDIGLLLRDSDGLEVDMYSDRDWLVIRCYVRDTKTTTDLYIEDAILRDDAKRWPHVRDHLLVAFNGIGHPITGHAVPVFII